MCRRCVALVLVAASGVGCTPKGALIGGLGAATAVVGLGVTVKKHDDVESYPDDQWEKAELALGIVLLAGGLVATIAGITIGTRKPAQ